MLTELTEGKQNILYPHQCDQLTLGADEYAFSIPHPYATLVP